MEPFLLVSCQLGMSHVYGYSKVGNLATSLLGGIFTSEFQSAQHGEGLPGLQGRLALAEGLFWDHFLLTWLRVRVGAGVQI